MPTPTDNRSTRFALVPFCALAQAFHARGLVRYEWSAVLKPVLDELAQANVNIIQMPCPETLFGGVEQGLARAPMSIEKYDTPAFRTHCGRLADDLAQTVDGLRANGYEVACILGLEYSPSCAARLQTMRRRTIHRRGIFLEELTSRLETLGCQVPVVGINRTGMRTTVARIHAVLAAKDEHGGQTGIASP